MSPPNAHSPEPESPAHEGAGARRAGLVALASGLVGFLWAWIGTSPALIMGINWDAATYLAGIARGGGSWSVLPWNSHLGILHVYLIGDAVAGAVGGHAIHGARLMNALALAGAGAAIGTAVCVATKRWWLALLAGALFCASWGESRLVFTLEDNVLYTPFAAGILALAFVFAPRGWSWRWSLIAGALGAAGWLMSWQAGVYLAPAMLVAVFGGGPRRWWTRGGDLACIAAAFVALVLAWMATIVAVSTLTFGQLAKVVLSRPEPSFFPKTLRQWWGLLDQLEVVYQHAGTGVHHELGSVLLTNPSAATLRSLGLGLLFVCVLHAIAATASAVWRRVRRGAIGPALCRWTLLAWTTLLITLAAAAYLDLPVDKYKRYDHLPLVLAFLLPLGAHAVVGALGATSLPRRLVELAPTVILAGLVALGATTSVVEIGRWHRDLPLTTPRNYAGYEHESWYGHVQRLRNEAPKECRFVFTLEELAHARWQVEITAALHAVLPDYVALGVPQQVAAWRIPIKVADDVSVARTLTGCEWLSPAAAARLQAAPR